MFDLNEAIDIWRSSLQRDGRINIDQLDELESHLRDEVDELIQQGFTTEEAFRQAVSKLGDANELVEEFSKVRKRGFGLVVLTNGKVIDMSDADSPRSRKFTWLLLFIGFCSITGWMGTNYMLLAELGYSWNLPGCSATLKAIVGSLAVTSFFIASAGVALVWGIRRLRRTSQKKQLVVRSVVPSVVLTPVLAVAGVALIVLTPYFLACAKSVVAGPNVVQSVWSPDGSFEAYVIDKPSLDGPNHHLYVRSRAADDTKLIARLPEDVDYHKEIHFSPYSDIVVFQSQFKLIAARLPDCKTTEVILGGEHHWRKNGTFWVDYENVKRPIAIEFPQPGTFRYKFAGSDQFETITIGSGLVKHSNRT